MKSNRRQIWWVAAIVGVIALLWSVYFIADPEKRNLDDGARAAAPGAFASLGDGVTHYELGGSGDPNRLVVLAAGFSVPYYIWDPTFKALTDAGFRVLRYDYYGRGYSDRPAIPFTDEMYVRQLDQLLNKLHVTMPIDLVGISFGGSFITSFADKYPDRVRSLVYFDPSIRRPYGLSLFEHMPLVWSYFTVLLDERFWADDQLGDFLHPERFPDWPKRYREQMQFKGFRRSRLLEVATNAAVDQSDQIKRVGQHPRPVLVIWGKQDKNVPFDESEFIMDALPQGHLVPIDDSGHLPQWEQPEAVNRELISFLKMNAG